MILVDANILLYAEDALNLQHDKAREWWDATLSGAAPVCLCWPVVSAFIRIGTNQRVFKNPLSLKQASARVDSWFKQPCVRMVEPTDRHWPIFKKLLLDGQATGNLVTDAHLAALAMEYGCQMVSADADFSRFPKLKWYNPLKG